MQLFDNFLLSRILVPILPSFLTEEKIEKEFLSTAIGIILNRDSQTKVVSSSETGLNQDRQKIRPDQDRQNCSKL